MLAKVVQSINLSLAMRVRRTRALSRAETKARVVRLKLLLDAKIRAKVEQSSKYSYLSKVAHF